MSVEKSIADVLEKLYAVNRIINAMHKKPHMYLDESLHASESHALKRIAENEGISQAELSDQLFCTPGATSVLVGNLVDRGLVRREREKGNQRRYLLTLTEHGREVHAAHIAFDEENARRANESMGLSEEQLSDLSAYLDQFIAYASRTYLDHGQAIL